MTSFFTTGGIRGGKKKMDKFYPRSFNMGWAVRFSFSHYNTEEEVDTAIRAICELAEEE